MNVKAILAAVLLAVAPSAAKALSCACAPCPFERPAPCQSDPEPPCCGDGDKEKEDAPACSCPHFDAPAALPSGDDAPMSPCTMSAEAPVHGAPFMSLVPEALRPPGRDPPFGDVSLFLLNLALRL